MLIKNKKAQQKLSILNIVIGVILLVILLPIIVIFSAGYQQCLNPDYPYFDYGFIADSLCCNTTMTIDSQCNETISGNVSSTNSIPATERTLLGLIGLFLILAFVYNLMKSTGFYKRKV